MEKELKRLSARRRKIYKILLGFFIVLLVYTIFAWFYKVLNGMRPANAWIVWTIAVYGTDRLLKKDRILKEKGVEIGEIVKLTGKEINVEKRRRNKRALIILLSLSILVLWFTYIYVVIIPIALIIIVNKYYKN